MVSWVLTMFDLGFRMTSDNSEASNSNTNSTTSTTSANKASLQADNFDDKTPPISTLSIEPNSTTVPAGAATQQPSEPASMQQLPGDGFSKRSNASSNVPDLLARCYQDVLFTDI